MSPQKDPSTPMALFGLLIASVGFIGFEMTLFYAFGWQVAALPVFALLAVTGYHIAWPPADGNAGAGGNGAGVPYVVRINPEDPDAGIPHRGA